MDSFARARLEPRAPRRVVTAPVTMQAVHRAGPQSNSDVIETLYLHPDARIVAFEAGAEDMIGGTGLVSPLPWTSRLERTVGVGELQPLAKLV